MRVWISSFLGGVGIGTIGALLTYSYAPWGLILSLLTILAAVHLLRRIFRRRTVTVVALIGWLVIMWRASTMGIGSEFLIQGDGLGMSYLLGGFLLWLFMLVRRD